MRRVIDFSAPLKVQ